MYSLRNQNLALHYSSHVGYQYLYLYGPCLSASWHQQRTLHLGTTNSFCCTCRICCCSTSLTSCGLASVEKQRLLLNLQDLSLQHITNILWTYASFLHDVPDMLPAFTSQILERSHKEQFNAQQLSNLLWSLCILQVCPLWPWLMCKWPWALGVWPWTICKLPLD